MITSLKQSVGQDSLPIDGRLILKSRDENVDGVAFVSGTQGVICTTFTEEGYHRITGERMPHRVCGSAVLVIPMDMFTIGEIIPHWRVS